MRIAARMSTARKSLRLEVEKADLDGDIFVTWEGNYLDRASARRLAAALLWAAKRVERSRRVGETR